MGDSSFYGALDMDRPRTAGVHITVHPVGKVNPSPVEIDETEQLIEEYLSPRKLKALTGVEDLEEVKYLEMRVDTSETSLGNFGALLPNLTQLKLSNSIIASIRDLGSSFPLLRILWMARCNLENLDGITSMTNLKELYLAYNEVSDLSPLTMMDQIEILDLEGNNIDDISQIEFLSLCSSMKNLTLDGNPVCVTPHVNEVPESGYDYRSVVLKTMPWLMVLDDLPTSSIGQEILCSNFNSDWNFLKQLEEDGTIGSLESVEEQELDTGTLPIRPTTGYRPGTSVRPSSMAKRLGTSRIIGTPAPTVRPATAQRPNSSDSGTYTAEQLTDASDLTTGHLICGNPSKALRSRRKNPAVVQQPVQTGMEYTIQKLRHKAEHTYPTTPNTEHAKYEEESDSLWEDLKNWRLHHETVHKKLEESRAPNILTIDYSDSSAVDDVVGDEEEDLGFVSRQDDRNSDDEELVSSSLDTPPSAVAPNTLVVSARRRRYKPAKDLSASSVTNGGDYRPISEPVAAPVYPKPDPKLEELKLYNHNQPVIVRADINSPEKVVIDRSSRTAKATVFSSALKHDRHKMSTLPSRPSVPK